MLRKYKKKSYPKRVALKLNIGNYSQMFISLLQQLHQKVLLQLPLYAI